jgi:thioredoxin-related protein
MLIRKIVFVLALLGVISSAQALDFTEVSKTALKEHKLILLSVESENCRYCEKMNVEVFTPT